MFVDVHRLALQAVVALSVDMCMREEFVCKLLAGELEGDRVVSCGFCNKVSNSYYYLS